MPLVGVLGPTSVIHDDGTVAEIPARRQAEVLAVLAAHRGHPASADTIADLVWRGKPPASAAVTLQGYVSRLRQLLDPDRQVRSAGTSLQTVRDGYRLGIETDVDRFEAMLAEARDLLPTRPLGAAELLEEALASWRGEAYVDVRDLADLAPEVERTDELRAVARELHGQALLDAGQDAEVVPELRRLVAEHPLRERGPALLATALFRSGRQGDALAVLRELRERLVDELGVDPGAEVVELEQRLLKQDPALRPHRPQRPHGPTAAPHFAGRSGELEALRGAWERARSGRVVTAVVRGEAGIGKTTLVEQLVTALGGAEVRWGRCPAALGAPAYWPWAQVLHGLPDAGGEREAGRFALGIEVARRLAELAGTEGALICLDDVQWADPDSLVVLETALAALPPTTPVLLVLTAREEPPRAAADLPRVLAALARRADHVDLALVGLDVAAAGVLAAGRSDTELAALVARTGGNPFFLRSLAVLDDTGALPATVRDTVRQRVGALPAGGVELMQVLALAARALALPVVSRAAGIEPAALEEAIAAALRAGLVDEPAPGRLRVAHDLVREAVEADLGPVARPALHGRLADAFEAAGLDAAVVVAEHRLAAAAGARDERAGRAALDAARAALASAALEDALELARRGLAVSGDPATTAVLHRVAGTAARRLGGLDESETAFRAAAEVARASGDAVGLAEAALESAPGGVGGYWALFALPLLGRSSLVDEALDAAGLPAVLRSRLLAASATQRAGAGQPGAAELAEEALAEAGDDPGARARALIAWVIATWTPDLAERRLAAVEELLRLAGSDPDLEATGLHLHRCVLLELGRTADAARAARRFEQLVERERDPDLALLETWWQIGWLVTRGDRDRARVLAAEAERASVRVSPTAEMINRVSRATIDGIAAWHDGRLVDEVPEAADLAAEVDPDFLLVIALAHAEAGHRDVALSAIDRLLAVPAHGQRLVPRTVMLTEALVALGDAERIAGLVPVLRSWGDRFVVQWPGDVCMGPAELYLGSALAMLGEDAEARTLLGRAVEQAELLGATPYAERARRRLAALQQRTSD